MKIILDGHKDFEKKFKIKFSEPDVRIHGNGFLSVTLDWERRRNCGDDFYKFKYTKLTHRCYGGTFYVKKKKYFNVVAASFEFEETIEQCEQFEITPWFNISICEEEESFTDGYDYIFFENTKYGLICWFAPKGWEDWNNAKSFKN